MQLIIDIGNSKSKIAVFDQRKVLHVQRLEHESTLITTEKLIKEWSITSIAYANVSDASLDLPEQILSIPALKVTHAIAPLSIDYKTPSSLGIDRLCAAVAASLHFPNQPTLSIDLGTCITYDLVSNAHYKGGGIAPGYTMRLKAMHRFTNRLPDVETTEDFELIGDDTHSSMRFGAGFGIVAEINGMINHFKRQYQDLKVILTGGDHSTFVGHVENPIFAAPNLVLEGINEILLHHIENAS